MQMRDLTAELDIFDIWMLRNYWSGSNWWLKPLKACCDGIRVVLKKLEDDGTLPYCVPRVSHFTFGSDAAVWVSWEFQDFEIRLQHDGTPLPSTVSYSLIETLPDGSSRVVLGGDFCYTDNFYPAALLYGFTELNDMIRESMLRGDA